MNNSQKAITSALEELGTELGISASDMRALVRKWMTDLKATHKTKK